MAWTAPRLGRRIVNDPIALEPRAEGVVETDRTSRISPRRPYHARAAATDVAREAPSLRTLPASVTVPLPCDASCSERSERARTGPALPGSSPYETAHPGGHAAREGERGHGPCREAVRERGPAEPADDAPLGVAEGRGDGDGAKGPAGAVHELAGDADGAGARADGDALEADLVLEDEHAERERRQARGAGGDPHADPVRAGGEVPREPLEAGARLVAGRSCDVQPAYSSRVAFTGRSPSVTTTRRVAPVTVNRNQSTSPLPLARSLDPAAGRDRPGGRAVVRRVGDVGGRAGDRVGDRHVMRPAEPVVPGGEAVPGRPRVHTAGAVIDVDPPRISVVVLGLVSVSPPMSIGTPVGSSRRPGSSWRGPARQPWSRTTRRSRSRRAAARGARGTGDRAP